MPLSGASPHVLNFEILYTRVTFLVLVIWLVLFSCPPNSWMDFHCPYDMFSGTCLQVCHCARAVRITYDIVTYRIYLGIVIPVQCSTIQIICNVHNICQLADSEVHCRQWQSLMVHGRIKKLKCNSKIHGRTCDGCKSVLLQR